MSFRSRGGQHLVRAVSTALVIALVLLLTPCCEVIAALAATDLPAHNDTLHAHQDDGDTPFSGEHCAPWLEQAYIPVGAAAPPALGPHDMDAPPPYALLSVQFPRMARIVPRAGAPPPTRAVYLLTSRFLL